MQRKRGVNGLFLHPRTALRKALEGLTNTFYSNGHGCMLQYALLHLFGYELSMDDLKAFRTVDSITPGHPEAHDTPGVEVTTGPLGQGFANAVGLAVAQAQTAATFNKPGYDLINNHTYCFFGDGCAMEGIASEAASAAGHLQLGNLIMIYDDNHISIGESAQPNLSVGLFANMPPQTVTLRAPSPRTS